MRTNITVYIVGNFTLTVKSADTNKGTVTGGGSIAVGASTKATATAKTGYTFSGWTSSNTSILASSTANPYTFNMPAGDVTLTAGFTANKYTVTYNANGGTCSTANGQQTYGSKYASLPTPTRTGYTFAGWYTAASAGTQVTTNTVVSTASNHTLYAHWTATTGTVSFDKQGGSGTANSMTVTFGK